jgi:hypothetical protein
VSTNTVRTRTAPIYVNQALWWNAMAQWLDVGGDLRPSTVWRLPLHFGLDAADDTDVRVVLPNGIVSY